jgi:hypothetical protein
MLAVLLLAPLAHLGFQTLQAVSHVRPGPYSVVTKHLEDAGHDRDPILITGGFYEEYLPKAQILYKPEDAQREEIEAVITYSDPYNRSFNQAATNYLASNGDNFEVGYTYTISKDDGPRARLDDREGGKIEVYTRKPNV